MVIPFPQSRPTGLAAFKKLAQIAAKEEIVAAESGGRKILKFKKAVHIAQLMGHIKNGGGEIDCGNRIGLQIIRLNENFIMLQGFEYAISETVDCQNYQKPVKAATEKRNDKPKEPERKEATIGVFDENKTYDPLA